MGNINSFRKEFGLILISGLIFTAALMWKDVLKEIEAEYFSNSSEIGKRVLYTLGISALLIYFAVHLKGLFGLTDDDDKHNMNELPKN
ncbi:MAG: hypothetical protein Harvfovirus70_10 [Harvfovirus sp.]|uniref:Uncharacterized protein n=1 Tax=Harvfovirus sp. TaxID=2487768 RepID=A0A3G5A5T9_9VIRU|nr:MAG: hypothetical protein Harvfovirus70_10 [Harvfovirus sp.]